jgi:putative intracellular protease/amidase
LSPNNNLRLFVHSAGAYPLRVQQAPEGVAKEGEMSGAIDVLNPDRPKRVVLLASNPAVSEQTGWPIGFWWAELTHPYWEFVERGYEVDVASPEGGKLEGDKWSDPRDESGYSADDLISLGFVTSPAHAKLVADSSPVAEVRPDDYDAILAIGGQGPMYTFHRQESVHATLRDFYEAGRPVAVICHATCALLETRLSDDRLLVEGKTWTGFANSEEDYVDEFVGQRVQPFRIEEEAKKLAGTNFIVASRFKSHAVRDGLLITGQQQYSGAAAARLIIEALGV